MGYVYYGNYAQYFEVARVEALRKLGMSYKELEDGGILLPVYNFSIKFIQPAYYDDLLKINTYIKKLPSASIHFDYETINSNGEVINQADTTLVFINKGTNKPQLKKINIRKIILIIILINCILHVNPIKNPIFDAKIIIGMIYIIANKISNANRLALLSESVISNEKNN